MKHNDKSSQSESSARLDSLLSDFLNKEIVEPVESPGRQATSLPLGDLFATGAPVAPESQPEPRAPTAAQKVVPVNRTEVWEATPKLTRPTLGLANLAVAELENDVDSILRASAAATRKRLFFGSIVCILLLLAGRSIWQSRKAADAQPISDEPEAVVLPSEVDPPAQAQTLSSTTTVPESLSETSAATAAPSSNRTPDGHSSVPVVVSDSPATDTASSVRSVSQSAVSNAAKLQQMPAPTLGHSNLALSTVQDLPSVQPVLPPAPLPLPPGPTDSAAKNVVPDSMRTTAAIPPLLVRKVQPIYPDLARRMNLAGTVHVAIVVDTSGKVASAEAIDGSPALRGAAELAVKQWRFRPSTMNGIPVIGKGTVSVQFSPDPR